MQEAKKDATVMEGARHQRAMVGVRMTIAITIHSKVVVAVF